MDKKIILISSTNPYHCLYGPLCGTLRPNAGPQLTGSEWYKECLFLHVSFFPEADTLC